VIDPVLKKLVQLIGDAYGYGALMQAAEEAWADAAKAHGHEGAEHTCGPCAAMLVPCPCDEACDWCCGTKRVTQRVAKAMLETRPTEFPAS
jgi:hypothetical protein